jgi:hypothetical protein
MRGGNSDEEEVLSQFANEDTPPIFRLHSRAIIQRSLKLIVNPTGATELYDLAQDPEETQPNPAALDGKGAGLLKALRGQDAGLSRRAGAVAQT